MRGLLIAFLASAAPVSLAHATARNEVVVDIRSNSEVLSSGSALSEESRRLKADMETMRLKSETMRRRLDRMGPARAAGGPVLSPAAAPTPDASNRSGAAPDSPNSERERVWPALIAVAACVLLFIFLLDRYGPKVRLRRPQVICPGCGKRLRVPRSRKRVRIRCPSCRRESAYNPQKKPRKR